MPRRKLKRSLLANSYPMYDEHDREHVIVAYRRDLVQLLASDSPLGDRYQAEIERLRALAERPEGVTLLCWCAPLACHAEVIRDILLASPAPTASGGQQQ